MQNKAETQAKLEAARGMVRSYFEAPDCPWEQRFHQDQRSCRECAQSYVCEWLFEQDPTVDLSNASAEQLREALSFAEGYLEGRMLEAGHQPADCPCAICSWVREVDPLRWGT